MTVTSTDPRTTTYQLSGWDLSALLPEPGEATITRHFADLEAAVLDFERCRERLSPGMDRGEFVAILHRYEELSIKMNRLSGYGSLWFASDTGSQAALTFRNRTRQATTAAHNRILFFTLWWRGLTDEEAEHLLPRTAAGGPPGSGSSESAKASKTSATSVRQETPDTSEISPLPEIPETHDLRHFLEDLRRLRPYTLDEPLEQVINVKDDNGIAAVLTLYSMLVNRFEFTLEVDGETRRLTRDALAGHAFSPRPEVRAATYQELYRVYAQDATVLGQIYVNRVRDWHEEHVVLRGYSSPIAVRNVDNDIPDAAVQALLEVARQNAHVFQRYFRLKASWLGLAKLRRYDLYAPLASSDRQIPYGDAVSSVLETFGAFHPTLARLSERVLAEKHMDSEIRKGKRGGAFCSTVLPGVTPWILINYSGRVRDIATLAHELGHAVHSMLSEHHSIFTMHASLPLAETASVFGEMLMTDRLLRQESDPLARRELLAASVDDVYATVLRQVYFVLFELEAHQAVLDGCSIDDLHQIYFDKLAQQFGDSIDVAPEFRYEWLSIPHIYQTPFYCYAYSFGQLLVLALYRRYQEQGEAFKPGYLRLLSYGGAARPEAILSEVGIDITDRAFWQGGFDLVRERIDELAGMKL
ncbi:MAG: M3 family oligoendopeptidase [Acidobacteriota bacterium]|nr:M3 family oligoendopeptidase [Acidobacteriota bacterium]